MVMKIPFELKVWIVFFTIVILFFGGYLYLNFIQDAEIDRINSEYEEFLESFYPVRRVIIDSPVYTVLIEDEQEFLDLVERSGRNTIYKYVGYHTFSPDLKIGYRFNPDLEYKK